MRRVSPAESNVPRVLFQHAINNIRMQLPSAILPFHIPPHRPEQRTLQILTMSGNSQVVSDPLCGLLVNGERPFLATLAHHPERLIPTVLMQLPHLEVEAGGVQASMA